ncbi:hypothetical protein BGW39_000612 [Mortierella sp. 14UC]|nr:hypothetical protein BGW39_000612 [Mortierella sp. 14UC]
MSLQQGQGPSTPRSYVSALQVHAKEQKQRLKKANPNSNGKEVTYSHNYQRLMRLGRKRTWLSTSSWNIHACVKVILCNIGNIGGFRSSRLSSLWHKHFDDLRTKHPVDIRKKRIIIKYEIIISHLSDLNSLRGIDFADSQCQNFDLRSKLSI